jgi:hypothetical protein
MEEEQNRPGKRHTNQKHELLAAKGPTLHRRSP